MRLLTRTFFTRVHSSFSTYIRHVTPTLYDDKFLPVHFPHSYRTKTSSRYFTSTHGERTEPGQILETTKARPRSPYAILKLKTSATKEDIKSSFRKLAKQFHPDLNPQLPPDISRSKMSEIIQAYDHLMDDDGGFSSRVGDARVALACEMFTLDELRINRLYDVYSFRILYDKDSCSSDGCGEELFTSDSDLEESTELNPFPIMELRAHPDDSISDFKRQIQSSFKEEWGLSGRRLDRDRIATGWELIKVGIPGKCKESEAKTDCDCNVDGEGDGYSLHVMSYHLFLHSYNIQHGNLIHAVVRKYQEGDENCQSQMKK